MTAAISYRMVSDALDPSVTSNWDLTPWLAAGALVLIGGLVGLTRSAFLPGGISRR